MTPEDWQHNIAYAECFIVGCNHKDIDPRGPIGIRGSKEWNYACTLHWEAILSIVGEQYPPGEGA